MARRSERLEVDPIHARVVRKGCVSDARPYWQAVVYRGGAEITVWTGRATRDELRDILTAKVRAGEVGQKEEGVGPVVTVGDLLDRWAGHQLALVQGDERNSTFLAYKGRARALKRTIGPVRLDRVTPATLQDHTARRGVRTATLANELVVFAAAWRWGFENGLVEDRDPPVARATKRRRRRGLQVEDEAPAVSDARAKYTPSADEVGRILEHLAPAWARLVGVIACTTGMRIGEIANLQWQDVDLERGLLHVRDQAGAKTGERWTPCPEDLVEELREWRPEGVEPATSLFPVSRRTVAKMWTQHYLPRACVAAKVPKVTAHAFRRFVIDAYANAGQDYVTTGKAMGNSPATQHKAYRTVQVADMQTAAKRARLRIPRKGKRIDLDAERKRRSGGGG